MALSIVNDSPETFSLSVSKSSKPSYAFFQFFKLELSSGVGLFLLEVKLSNVSPLLAAGLGELLEALSIVSEV